jgi:F-type H+-transporting ATPase subunit epsilon
MASFHFTIVSTNGKAFDGDVESVVLPGVEGEFGVLSAHAPLIAALKLGVIKVTQGGMDKFFMVGNGYLDVANNQASVLVGLAAAIKDRATGLELIALPKPWEALEAMTNR